MGGSQEGDFSVKLPQDEFTKNLKPLMSSPGLGAARQRAASPEATELRQCKLGEFCSAASVSRPDICASLARVASYVSSPQGSDVHRIDDVVKTAEVWRQVVILKYASSSHLGAPARGDVDGRVRCRPERMHCETTSSLVASRWKVNVDWAM